MIFTFHFGEEAKSFLMILIITLSRMVLRKRADSCASIVEAPKQRSSREENKQIKNGDIPENWTEKKLRRKDIEADWVKKNGTSYLWIQKPCGSRC
jgi:hypothetical protein